jgi:hypothetical protein
VFTGTESKGRDLIAARNKAPMAGLGITKGDQRNGFIDFRSYPLLAAHGNAPDQAIHPGNLKATLDPKLHRVEGEAVLDGVRCLVLRETVPPPGGWPTEYWVDPAREHIPVRMMERIDGKPFLDTLIRYQKTAAGWLPAGWTATQVNPEVDRFEWIVRMRVTSLDPDYRAAADEFDLKPRPGELVVERTNTDGKMWNARNMPPAKYFRANERGELIPIEPPGVPR